MPNRQQIRTQPLWTGGRERMGSALGIEPAEPVGPAQFPLPSNSLAVTATSAARAVAASSPVIASASSRCGSFEVQSLSGTTSPPERYTVETWRQFVPRHPAHRGYLR